MRQSRSKLSVSVGLLTLPLLLSTYSLAQELAEAALLGNEVQAQALIDNAVRAQALVDRDSYQRTITDLEARQGIYSEELSEAYRALGTTLRKLDQHDEAAEAFGKALQALRIGYGLNDIRQLPLLEELRVTNEQLANWDEVHSATHLTFHIAKHNPAAGEDVRVKSLRELGHWLRRANAEELMSPFESGARRLKELYKSEIERLEERDSYTGRNIHLASLYLDLAATELSEAKRKYDLPISEFQTPSAGDQRTVTTQQCFAVVDRSGRAVQVCNPVVETPNINYYLAPNAQKNSEIRAHLAEVESKVTAAYYALQDKSEPSDAQTALLTEMHRLTGEYNAFIEENRNQSTPLR